MVVFADSEMFEGASWDGIVQVGLKTNRIIDHFERAASCSASGLTAGRVFVRAYHRLKYKSKKHLLKVKSAYI